MIGTQPTTEKVGPLVPDSPVKAGPVVPKKPRTKRPWIKERLSREEPDVENILANWRTEGQCSPNLLAAIRLYNAYLTGNIDAMRQFAPMLPVVFGSGPKPRRSPSPSYSDSDLKKEDSLKGRGEEEVLEEELRPVETALADVTGMDIDIPSNEQKIRPVAIDLLRAHYTAEDIRTWRRRWWDKRHSWGQQGKSPTLAMVTEHIRNVRDLPPEGPPVNVYLQHPFFKEEV